jgi:polyphosphate kinase 2 (PPK2 family)
VEHFQHEFEQLSLELGEIQRKARGFGLPSIVIFDGWETAGKGAVIQRLALTLDPRGYRVVTVKPVTDAELFWPPLYRFWRDLPEPGQMVLYNQSYYDRLWRGLATGEIGKRQLEVACKDICAFEQTLQQQGYIIFKFFLHITHKEQKRRFHALQSDKHLAWRINAAALRQNHRYEDWSRAVAKVMTKTQMTGNPFVVVDSSSRKAAALLVLEELRRGLLAHLGRSPSTPAEGNIVQVPEPHRPEATPSAEVTPQNAPIENAPEPPHEGVFTRRISSGPNRLNQVDLTQTLSPHDYEQRLAELKHELGELANRIYTARVGVIVLYEGWDAAGKGGSIRRLASALDPRGYEVIPIAAPTKAELAMHYLWRFSLRLPKAGHIAIFDRTWYGRVLVERVEGFCPESKWRMAYDEIRDFEDYLVRWGYVLVKFWIHIDKDEQLRRFQAREQDPAKHWKITPEDWRNRDKWDAYEAAVADMLDLTSTERCPWTVIAGNDKLFARISALRTVADTIRASLDG